MHTARKAALLITAAAGFPAAADITLRVPVDCNLGQDCFIQQYVDHDDGPGVQDFRCQSLANDGHTGTDFRVPSTDDMLRGVDVVAASPGRVRGTRDGMADKLYERTDAESIAGRECGNGVLVDHEDGWTTQYCHLKNGSVLVKTGDIVQSGQVIGQIGASGQASFPHVHFTLRRDGQVVDPFAPTGEIACAAPLEGALWDSPVPYQAGAVMDVGLSDAVPTFDAIKAGTATQTQLDPTAPALVVFGFVFAGQAGDALHLAIKGPDGTVIEDTVELTKSQPQLFRAIGKRLRTGAWPPGMYQGTVTMQRRGQVLSTRTATVTIGAN